MLNFINFNTLTTANPYVFGSAPDNITTHSLVGASEPIITAFGSGFICDTGHATVRSNTALTGNEKIAGILINDSVPGNSIGVGLVDASGNGYHVITSSSNDNFRIFLLENGLLTGSPLSVISVSPLPNSVIELKHSTGGVVSVWQNNVNIGEITDATYSPSYPVAISRGGYVNALTGRSTGETVDVVDTFSASFDYIERISYPVTASAGDVLIFSVCSDNNVLPDNFTWNGAAANKIGTIGVGAVIPTQYFTLTANVTGTFNLTTPTFNYFRGQLAGVVVRGTNASANLVVGNVNILEYKNEPTDVSVTATASVGSKSLLLGILNASIYYNGDGFEINTNEWTVGSSDATVLDREQHPLLPSFNKAYVVAASGSGLKTIAMTPPAAKTRFSFISFTVTEASVSIDSINGIQSPMRGQTDVIINTTGFTAKPTFTTNKAGITFSNVTGANNVWHATLSNYVEDDVYPVLPATVTVTATSGSDVTTKETIVVENDDYVTTVLNAPIYTNDEYLGYTLDQSGHIPATGDLFIYKVVTGLTDFSIDDDGAINTKDAGSFEGWHRVAATGKLYHHTVTVNVGGGAEPEPVETIGEFASAVDVPRSTYSISNAIAVKGFSV